MRFLIVENNKVVNVILAESKDLAETITAAIAYDTSLPEYTNVGIGWVYDDDYNRFRNPNAPYPSWIFDIETWDWQAPVLYPDDGMNYIWNEDTISWDLTQE